jgi:hypothetical protein
LVCKLMEDGEASPACMGRGRLRERERKRS